MATQKCPVCEWPIFSGGVQDGENLFCSAICHEFFLYPDFCPACAAETTDLPPGNTTLVNGFGTALYGGTTRMEFFRHGELGGSGKCPTCFSVVKTKWWCLIMIPVFQKQTYRIKNLRRGYLGRFLPPENVQPSIARATGKPN